MKLGENWQYPPWLVPSTFTLPQKFAFFAREQAGIESVAQGIAIANRMRARKGLPPMGTGLPDSCRLPPPGWKKGDKGFWAGDVWQPLPGADNR